MARSGRLEVRDLPFDPDIDEAPLEHVSNFGAELGNRIDLPLEFSVSHDRSIVYRSCGSRPRQTPRGEVWLTAFRWDCRFRKASSYARGCLSLKSGRLMKN